MTTRGRARWGVVWAIALGVMGVASTGRTEAAPGKTDSGVTTLEDITIEGEIAMPQVLFITARDQYRYRDFLHRRYLPGADALRGSIEIPYRFWVPETGLQRWYGGAHVTLGGGAGATDGELVPGNRTALDE